MLLPLLLLNVRVGFRLISLLSFIQLISCKSSIVQWKRLRTQQCLPQAMALRVDETPSGTIECAILSIVSGVSSGLLVAQFDSDTRQCSLFQYIAVCHLIDGFDAAEGGGDRTHLSCAAFANYRAANFITLSRKLMLGVGSKLRAAWVMSDDADASRSNLVCGQTQQWMSEGVEWSSEGARFDGVSSKMWLENVKFANLQQGLTWLVRLKRNPRVATLLETYLCNNHKLGAAFWDGSPSMFGLYFFRYPESYSEFTTAPATNSFDPGKFVEVGVTSPVPSSRHFFSNSELVPQSSVVQISNHLAAAEISNFNCITSSLGFRVQHDDPRRLKGTVRMVAIMNDSMTATEIKHLFGLVR